MFQLRFFSVSAFARLAVCLAIMVCGCASSVFVPASRAQELSIVYRNKTRLTAVFPGETIDWVTVAPSGNLIERIIDIADIQSLSLATTESSRELAQIQQNVIRLGDADYLVREQAERELANEGGSAIEMLKPFADSPSYEVRHRVGRLLEGFGKRSFKQKELDTLVLSDGQTLQGEARGFRLQPKFRGTPIEIHRKNIAQLRKKQSGLPAPPVAGVAPSMVSPPLRRPPVETKMFHNHKDFFAAGQTEFTFDIDSNGEKFRDRTVVDDLFADRGLLLRNEARGNVRISPYGFGNILPGGWPAGGKSVGLHSHVRGAQQNIGVMEIRFCVPGSPDVPAGVKEFGLFIARVKHSRDIVMEAYNAQGHVLATVEATDQQCIFAGVKSNDPIVRLRIFSNPWLGKLKRKIDKDFTIDTLRMSTPEQTPDLFRQDGNRTGVRLNNGDFLNVSSISVTTAGDLRVLVQGIAKRPSEFLFKKEELAAIHFGSIKKLTNTWKAMLTGGSIVNVTPGETMRSKLMGKDFFRKDLIALWPGGTPGRLPTAGDFPAATSSQSLVVFPGCRIQSDPFDFGPAKISWTVNKKIQEQLILGRPSPARNETPEDPSTTETSFDWTNTTAAQRPTFWIRPPLTSAALVDAGVVELADGQRLLFGRDKPLQFESMNARHVDLKWQEKDIVTIPISSLRAIRFPQPQ